MWCWSRHCAVLKEKPCLVCLVLVSVLTRKSMLSNWTNETKAFLQMQADEENGAAFKGHFWWLMEFNGGLVLMCDGFLTGADASVNSRYGVLWTADIQQFKCESGFFSMLWQECWVLRTPSHVKNSYFSLTNTEKVITQHCLGVLERLEMERLKHRRERKTLLLTTAAK